MRIQYILCAVSPDVFSHTTHTYSGRSAVIPQTSSSISSDSGAGAGAGLPRANPNHPRLRRSGGGLTPAPESRPVSPRLIASRALGRDAVAGVEATARRLALLLHLDAVLVILAELACEPVLLGRGRLLAGVLGDCGERAGQVGDARRFLARLVVVGVRHVPCRALP